MSVGNAFLSPHFIKAGSPERLRLAMLENNLNHKKEFKYFSVVYDGKIWVAWYYKVADEAPMLLRKVGADGT